MNGSTEPTNLPPTSQPMKKERYAVGMIILALFAGMLLAASTSGCDTHNQNTTAQAATDN